MSRCSQAIIFSASSVVFGCANASGPVLRADLLCGFFASATGAESAAPCALGISLSGCACATVTPDDRCSEPKSSSVQTLCGLEAAFCCRAKYRTYEQHCAN